MKENEAIAVVGMACRLPSAQNTQELWWKVLSEGKDCIGEGNFPRGRAEDIKHVMPVFEKHLNDPAHPFFNGSWFESVDKFDAQFFSIFLPKFS
jgi:acyl transferase domain-containing protein